MARMIETTIDIDAPTPLVWNTLTDFERFPEWSTFILGLTGDVAVGNSVVVRLNDGGGEMKMTPRIIAREDLHKLIWRGKMGASWLFSGEHRFVLTELEGGKTRFSHSEEFTGILVPLLWKIIDKRTRPAFVAFNKALCHRCENQQETGLSPSAVAS